MTTAVQPRTDHHGPTTAEVPTAGPTATSSTALIEALVADALRAIDGQLLVSQSFCVDVLLDLYNAAEGPVVRSVTAERLDDIRRLNAVAVEDFQADLWALLAIVGAEAVLADA